MSQARIQARIVRKAKEKGVEFIGDPVKLAVRCKQCGQGWLLYIQTGGRMPRRWWMCPRGCNEPEE